MKNKEKRLGGKLSNRTKVIGAMTILLGIGTAVSMVSDNREISQIEEVEEIIEELPEQITDVVENIEF